MSKFHLVALAKQRLNKAKGDDGFTLVEMVVALTVVLLMAGAALLAAPGIIKQSRIAACDAQAGSIANAIVASYAANGDYSQASAADLVTDEFLVAVPADYTIGTPRASGVTVTFGAACTGDFAPSTWGPGATVDYDYGDGSA